MSAGRDQPPDDLPTWESEPVDVLRRWEASGAVWKVTGSAHGATVIGLFSCDGGELVASFRCADEAVSGFLGGRTGN